MRRFAPRQIAASHARLGADLRAVTAIEYALITAIMAMVIVTGVALFGGDLGVTYGHVSDSLISANSIVMPPASNQAAIPASSTPSPQGTTGANNNAPVQTVQTKTATPGAPSN